MTSKTEVLQRPKVGVTVLVFKEGKILLGKRTKTELAGEMYQTPGGHLEHLESVVECAHRELREEADIEIQNVQLLCVKNVREFAPAHYIILCVRADWKSGEIRNCEGDKCEGWEWYSLNQLPSPLTPASESAIRGFLEHRLLFD